MFKKAIVKTPGESLVNGLSRAGLGHPNYEQALVQHGNYIDVLKHCGLEVIILEKDENFPDSTFVEDVALLTPECAIVTNPGAASRRGEVASMQKTLEKHFIHIEKVFEPGRVDAGDIMMVGAHYYIGLSERTNQKGALQVIKHLESYGMTGSTVELKHVLHLKTGVAYLEHNNLVASGEFLSKPEFEKFNILEIDAVESYAANCIWVNDRILLPVGYPKAYETLSQAGLDIIEVDVSEFRKLDGGLSCLSLRF
ncbi:N(G),N(G)-dimethylarginine dimethylaminohydrolase [bacterium]|nr:N(G),N(G)-dimethylarginine dimethylaminohydrolase [bacterium]